MDYSEQKETVQDIATMLNGMPYNQAKRILDEVHEKIIGSLKISLTADEQAEQRVGSKLDEHIKEIIKAEADRRAWQNLKATYPPEFVKGLEEVFRGLKRDSRG